MLKIYMSRLKTGGQKRVKGSGRGRGKKIRRGDT
jgi:hypothetical protein